MALIVSQAQHTGTSPSTFQRCDMMLGIHSGQPLLWFAKNHPEKPLNAQTSACALVSIQVAMTRYLTRNGGKEWRERKGEERSNRRLFWLTVRRDRVRRDGEGMAAGFHASRRVELALLCSLHIRGTRGREPAGR